MMNLTSLIKFPPDRLQKMKFTGWVLLLFSCLSLNAQTGTVSGTVSGADNGDVLPIANVKIKGTNTGVATDIDGRYSIEAAATDVLVFSYIGYTDKEVAVGNQKTINVSLATSSTTLEDVVVVGYSTQKKSDLTGAVGIVDVEDAKKTVTYDVAKMLQGQAAGVTVQSSGEPGGFVNIKIRGLTSLRDNNPLFVIDGILVDAPNDFAPGDIESIQILKDASSAAIYGVRGANGVVIITTKKGKAGKVAVNFKSVYGFQNIDKRIPLLNREQYQQVTNEAYINGERFGSAVNYGLPANDLNNPANAGGPGTPNYAFIDNIDTDWQEETFRTGTIQNQSFNVSGGTDKFTMNLNVDNFQNKSYMNVPQDFVRKTISANLTANLGRFKFGSKIMYVHSNKQRFAEYLAGANAINTMLQAIPTMPVYDPNRLGGYGGADNGTQLAITLNPVGWFNLAEATGTRDRFVGNIWGEVEILKGLKYTMRASADRLNYQDRLYIPESDLGWYYITTAAEAEMSITDGTVTKTILDNLLTYETDFGKHHIDLLAGYVQEKSEGKSNFIRRTGFPAGTIPQITYGTEVPTVSEYADVITRMSSLARADYNFDDRYFLTLNYRNDSSSLFRDGINSEGFYSVAGMWKAHNDFKLPDWWSMLKLRGGYGTVGNNAIGPYAYSSQVNAFAGSAFTNPSSGSQLLAPGTTVVTLVDPNITWETTTSANAAIELGFFNDKLQFTAEYYIKKTTDMLAEVPLPYSTGSFPANILTNACDMENKGLEFSLSYQDNEGDFQWGANANFSTLKNEITKIGEFDRPITVGAFRTEVGRSVGEIYAYEVQGLFQTDAEIADAAFQPNAQPGSIRYRDLNGDDVIDDNDRSFQGTTIPKYNFGLNLNASYKNFDVSVFFQGQGGNKIYSETYRGLMIGGLNNAHTDILDYWTPTNTDTNIPRPDYNQLSDNNRASNRWIMDGDFIRMQSAEIGYSVPVGDTKIFDRLRIYVSGQNLFTITDYKMFDPDFNSNGGVFDRGLENGSYPNPRTILMGVDITF